MKELMILWCKLQAISVVVGSVLAVVINAM